MVREIVERYENVLLVGVAAAVGLLVPHLGPYLEPFVTPIVIFLVYSSLRGLRLDEIEVSSYAALSLLSVGISYVLLPVGGMHIVDRFLAEGVVVGFAIALSVPTTTGTAIIWTRFSRGDVQLATTISLVSLLIAPVATPVVLRQLVGSQMTVPVTEIFLNLVVIIVGGGLLAVGVPSSAISAESVDTGSTLAILALIYTSTAGVELGGVSAVILLAIVGVSVLLLGFGLAVALLCEKWSGLERTRSLPLFFTSNLKNLGIALLIGSGYGNSLIVVSIIVYYVVQQLAGALIADTVA